MRWESFHIILSLGAIIGRKIRQFDIKSAYLHGIMREEVWVQQPEGFEVPSKDNLALLLQNALYGTKQGGNESQKTLYEFMRTLEWIFSNYNVAVFFKLWNDNTWAIIGVWVDDATSTRMESRLLELEDAVMNRFSISSEGEAHWILSTSIHHGTESHSVSISQRDYIESLAVKFNVQNAKPIKSPIPLGIDFSAINPPSTKEEKKDTESLPYRKLIGSLMFTAMVSRPDIAYSVNKVAQYSSNPSLAH